MDTPRATPTVEQQTAHIKAHMPGVYQAIQAKAKDIGNQAFALVRRGLRGEPDCFYAIEAGHVVGTPFNQAVSAEIARYIVQFGCSYLCLWSAPQEDSTCKSK